MSDFYLDFGTDHQRNALRSERSLRFYDDMRTQTLSFDGFSLALSRADNWDIWGPGETDEGVFVALAGRVAFEEIDWNAAIKDRRNKGGRAASIILNKYQSSGTDALTCLNGNLCIILYNPNLQRVHIVTDRAGMVPCFLSRSIDNKLIMSTHADILAKTQGIESKLDRISLAEFIETGKVSAPYTFYEKIKLLQSGSLFSIDLKGTRSTLTENKYFHFNFSPEKNKSADEFATELGNAFSSAVRRRTLSYFGKTAVSLSGGLDSRILLCCVPDRKSLVSFSFFDKSNRESDIAQQVAKTAGIDFIRLQRPFEYYGANAEEGVRISGGMGDLGSNHYTGFRNDLLKHGIDNLLAGFYCDYLFKGLVLNKRENKLIRRESLTAFNFQTYMPLYHFDSPYSEGVHSRLLQLFPPELQADQSPEALLTIENRRIFPLCYEPDNQETLIPQRTLGWYLPIVDNDILDIYLRIPPALKLNTFIYQKMALKQCGPKFSQITNINTGSPIGSPWPVVLLTQNLHALLRKFPGRSRTIATDESWPNWRYYLLNSRKIAALWSHQNDEASQLLNDITAKNICSLSVIDFDREDRLKLFLRLLTLKIWLQQHFHA